MNLQPHIEQQIEKESGEYRTGNRNLPIQFPDHSEQEHQQNKGHEDKTQRPQCHSIDNQGQTRGENPELFLPVQPKNFLISHLEPEGIDEQGEGHHDQEDSDNQRQKSRAWFPESADGHPQGTNCDQKTAYREEQAAYEIVFSHRTTPV